MTRPASAVAPGIGAAAADQLTTALRRLAHRGERPPCAEPQDGELWLSERPEDRARAAGSCSGCPVLAECRTSAEANGERFGVWAGVDRTPTTRRPHQAWPR